MTTNADLRREVRRHRGIVTMPILGKDSVHHMRISKRELLDLTSQWPAEAESPWEVTARRDGELVLDRAD